MKQKKYILALILLLYPLRHCYIGLDLMDAGYSLGNYRFFDTMNETWKLATYLSNVIGMMLTNLPWGDTWIGMNVYTGLMIGMTAAGTYLFLVHCQPKENKKELPLFIAELGAISFCWAPSVILYHYLGYILMTVATGVLYKAILKDNIRYYIVAGIILGVCVAVRMPNITYIAFILPLWYYCFIKRGNDKAWFGKLVNRTLYCVCGYAIGAVIPIAYIELRYGISSYPDMISSLFGMTETATDYKPTSMVSAMLGDYMTYSGWLLVFLVYILIGVVFFWLLSKIEKIDNKITAVFKTLYGLGFCVVLRFCYGRGMFGLDYSDNFSIYKWITVYLLMVIILCIWAISSKKADEGFKLWAVFLLVTIFITPLGSNNGLYPIINNLFIVAPVSVLMLGEFYKRTIDTMNDYTSFVTRTVITCVMICIFTAGILYGINFVFHDELGGNVKRERITLKCDTVANGLLTTTEKREALESLDDFLYCNGLNKKSLITYGQVPTLSYILNMEPAIYTTWIDLDSNSLSRLEKDLESLSECDKEDLPIIIMGVEYVDNLMEQSGDLANRKFTTIEKYMNENNYIKVYENSAFRVYNIK